MIRAAAGHVCNLGYGVGVGEGEIFPRKTLEHKEVVFGDAADIKNLLVLLVGERFTAEFFCSDGLKESRLLRGLRKPAQNPLPHRLTLIAFLHFEITLE